MGNQSSAPRVSAADKAILDLKNQRDKLHQYQKKLTGVSATTHALAKQALAANNRSRALLYLRQKKYHSSLLERTDAQLAQLEQLTADVEFAQIQRDVFFGLQQGNEALKLIHREMGGLENVQRVMDSAHDEAEFQREVGELLAGRMSREEEDAAEEELEALELQLGLATKNKPKPAVVDSGLTRLPSVPNGEPAHAAPLDASEGEQAERPDERTRVRSRQAVYA